MVAHFIVTPVRNAVRTIDATIWSIVSQVGDLDIHYHIQDGGSVDGTVEKIQSWGKRIDCMNGSLPSRVHFTFDSRPDKGMYDAIATGFSRMTIPPHAFMSWCNADDALWPGGLDAVARLARDLPQVDWVMGWPAWFDSLNRFSAIERSPRYPQAILAAGLADGIHWPFVQQESTFWRKRLWDEVGGLDVSLKLAGDWDLWVRFARLSPLVHANRQLGAFYVRQGQQSENMTHYRAEMNSKHPLWARRHNLRKEAGRGTPLTSFSQAFEGDSGEWTLATRACSRSAKVVAQALSRLASSPASLSKLLYKVW